MYTDADFRASYLELTGQRETHWHAKMADCGRFKTDPLPHTPHPMSMLRSIAVTRKPAFSPQQNCSNLFSFFLDIFFHFSSLRHTRAFLLLWIMSRGVFRTIFSRFGLSFRFLEYRDLFDFWISNALRQMPDDYCENKNCTQMWLTTNTGYSVCGWPSIFEVGRK